MNAYTGRLPGWEFKGAVETEYGSAFELEIHSKKGFVTKIERGGAGKYMPFTFFARMPSLKRTMVWLRIGNLTQDLVRLDIPGTESGHYNKTKLAVVADDNLPQVHLFSDLVYCPPDGGTALKEKANVPTSKDFLPAEITVEFNEDGIHGSFEAGLGSQCSDTVLKGTFSVRHAICDVAHGAIAPVQ